MDKEAEAKKYLFNKRKKSKPIQKSPVISADPISDSKVKGRSKRLEIWSCSLTVVLKSIWVNFSFDTRYEKKTNNRKMIIEMSRKSFFLGTNIF